MALSTCTNLTDLYDRELIRHGDPAFPIACYHDDLSQSNVPWHWHEEWEFAIVSEGLPEFLMENHHLKIKKGDGIFFNSRALHAVTNNPEAPGRLHSGVFHPRLIGGSTDSIFWQSLVLPFQQNPSMRFLLLHESVPWEQKVLQHFEAVWKAIAYEQEDYENLVRYELSAAIGTTVRNTDFSAAGLSDQELINAGRIRSMLEYIEEHYNDDLNVDTLAEQISVSPSVCLRCFHQTLNTTPMQYVKQLRLKKSAHQLLNTKKTAKEIALSCGFNDISYFTKSFRELYHCTPGEYRSAQRPKKTADLL
ncbi:MAG: AraC family transcriptional regulator [Lachnospiraceae bacterium]|nr:AraC family transcriptional regulator [Lachnospiraceae bacterium]